MVLKATPGTLVRRVLKVLPEPMAQTGSPPMSWPWPMGSLAPRLSGLLRSRVFKARPVRLVRQDLLVPVLMMKRWLKASWEARLLGSHLWLVLKGRRGRKDRLAQQVQQAPKVRKVLLVRRVSKVWLAPLVLLAPMGRTAQMVLPPMKLRLQAALSAARQHGWRLWWALLVLPARRDLKGSKGLLDPKETRAIQVRKVFRGSRAFRVLLDRKAQLVRLGQPAPQVLRVLMVLRGLLARKVLLARPWFLPGL